MRTWTTALLLAAVATFTPGLAAALLFDQLDQPEPAHTRLRRGTARASQWMHASSTPLPPPASFDHCYRIQLRIDVEYSGLTTAQLGVVLSEINAIWRQAGIVFDAQAVGPKGAAEDELVLRFVAGSPNDDVFGMYDGHRDVWSRDRPPLAAAPHPVLHPGARTASHELGHVLGLLHHRDRPLSIDSLMTSGRKGFRLDADEIAVSRAAAAHVGRQSADCSASAIKPSADGSASGH